MKAILRIIVRFLKVLYKKTIIFLQNKYITVFYHSIFLLFISYFWLNFPFSHDSENKWMSNFALFTNLFEKDINQNIENVLCINTTYSKMLVSSGFNREIPITDRIELSELFEEIGKYNSHKHIICDIMFEDKTKMDFMLSEALQKVERIIVPEYINNDGDLIKPIFQVQSGNAGYLNSFYSGQFSKIRLFGENELETIPYILYQKLDKKKIQRRGWFYFDSNKLCYNSLFVNFKIKKIEQNTKNDLSSGNSNGQVFYDLTQFLKMLKVLDDDEKEDLFLNKMILIGAFEKEDNHGTIFGEIPGILILFNAYLNLKKGLHIVPISLYSVLFLIYYLLSYNLFYKLPYSRFFNFDRLLKSSLWVILTTFLTYSLLFIIISIVIYFIYAQITNFYLLILYFTFMDLFINYIYKRKQNKLGTK